MHEYKSYINVVKSIIIVSPYRSESNGKKIERIRRNRSRMQVFGLLINMDRINFPYRNLPLQDKFAQLSNCLAKSNFDDNFPKSVTYLAWFGEIR